MSLHAASVKRGDRWVLNHIEWRLRPGERWALLGDNGSGKTQLLKLLSGAVWPTPRGTAAQRDGLLGDSERCYTLGTRRIDLPEAKPRIAYLGAESQDKYTRYGWNLCIRDLIATGLHRTDLLLQEVTAQQARRVRAVMRSFALQHLALRPFSTLSYGQKRVALLARAMAGAPDWLLLDEFYNGLDDRYRRRIDALLDCARSGGQSWVASAHRAVDVPSGTQRLLELRGGKVHAVKALRRANVEAIDLRAEDRPKPARRSSPRHGSRAKGRILLELIDVDLYVEYRSVLRSVNWCLRRGEHWAVYGANGAGKSSFLKLLYGDLAPALGGRIERKDFARGTPIREWKRRVGFVSPELQTQYLVDVSILELVASGPHASIGLVDPPTPSEVRSARHWLRFFGLTGVARRRPRELSYGQLRRALIARAMAAQPTILLLDEPLTGLDPTQRALMKGLLTRLMRRRLTLIAAVHHPEDLPAGIRRVLHLERGAALEATRQFAT